MSSISTYEQTGSAARGATVVTLADATGVAVGQSVAGVGVASGTKVGAISGTALTLTAATTDVLGSFTQAGSTIAPFTETGTFINYYVTVTLANANGAIAVGQTVTGTGIAANTKVRFFCVLSNTRIGRTPGQRTTTCMPPIIKQTLLSTYARGLKWPDSLYVLTGPPHSLHALTPPPGSQYHGYSA